MRAAPASQATTSAQHRADTAALGRQMFVDASLSASGRQSCSSCHSPEHAYGPPDGPPVQPGGEHMDRQGLRTAPSLRYVLPRTSVWYKEHQRDPIERAIEIDSVPTGGFARDGRFDNLRDQARAPLFDPAEMANRDEAALAARLRAAPYAQEFARVFGAAALADNAKAVDGLAQALERFELDDPSFAPYSSKFDRYLKGQARLSKQEARGLLVFVDPAKGNCASCHIVAPGANGAPPLLTDYSFAALGVPRNRKLAANADAKFYDEGLCGPLRKPGSIGTDEKYCGMFKTPSLRNVATRQAFMHNGVFDNLADVVRFYAQRDTNPARWYPRQGGKIEQFDDLPPEHRGNVDRLTPPMDRHSGDTPAMTESEILDVVAFLRTLSDDDVRPPAAAARVAPRQVGAGGSARNHVAPSG